MSLNPFRSLLKTGLVVTTVGLITAGSALGASHHSSAHKSRPKARAAITTLNVSGARITVIGRVKLSPNTAAARKRVNVVVTLTNSGGTHQKRTVSISAKRAYKVSWSTTFTGKLTLTVRATISRKVSGTLLKRHFTIAQQVTPTPPVGGTPLVGTFKLTAGSTSGAASGSYFEMLLPGGGVLANLSSPAANKGYTPFTPGTDGGLETFAYQSAPNPSFAGGTTGGALANKIIQPVPFYGVNFSIETSSKDAQLGSADPLPVIKNLNGKLSGQVTAWDAQWNGQSFNQGTPKPDGSLPAPTTHLTGTYDATTHKFTLQWESLIVGGPFNGFTGAWYLAGTFVPQASTSILPLGPLGSL